MRRLIFLTRLRVSSNLMPAEVRGRNGYMVGSSAFTVYSCLVPEPMRNNEKTTLSAVRSLGFMGQTYLPKGSGQSMRNE